MAKNFLDFTNRWFSLQTNVTPEYEVEAKQSLINSLNENDGYRPASTYQLLILSSAVFVLIWMLLIGFLLPDYNGSNMSVGVGKVMDTEEIQDEVCEIEYSFKEGVYNGVSDCPQSDTIPIYYNPIYPKFNSLHPTSNYFTVYIAFWPVLIFILTLIQTVPKILYLRKKNKKVKQLSKSFPNEYMVDEAVVSVMTDKLGKANTVITYFGGDYTTVPNYKQLIRSSVFIPDAFTSRAVGVGPEKVNYYEILRDYNERYYQSVYNYLPDLY